MQNFTLYNPVKVVFGPGELKQLGIEAKAIGKKALLVSYKEHEYMVGTLETAVKLCAENGVATIKFFEAVANPTMTEIEAGIALAQKEGVDMVIGIGGGSVMDTAKLVAAGVKYSGNPWKMINSRHDVPDAVAPTDALPIIQVPTLPATSSEMNAGAVCTNPATKEKSYVFAGCLYAKTAIMDPELTTTLPAYQTACGAADAISHVMEVYFNGAIDTPFQDRMMEGLLITIMDQVKKALANPKDVNIRSHLMWESCVAWNGWTTPGTIFSSPMHMIAHSISGRFNVAHGATLSMIMPAYMKYTYKNNVERYVIFGERVLGMKQGIQTAEAFAVQVIEAFETFLKEIKVPVRMSECKISANDIEMLLDDSVRVYFGADGKLGAFVPLTKDDARKVLELAL